MRRPLGRRRGRDFSYLNALISRFCFFFAIYFSHFIFCDKHSVFYFHLNCGIYFEKHFVFRFCFYFGICKFYLSISEVLSCSWLEYFTIEDMNIFVLFIRQPDPEITQIIWLYLNIHRQTAHAQRTLKMCNNYFGLYGIFIFDLNQLNFQTRY